MSSVEKSEWTNAVSAEKHPKRNCQISGSTTSTKFEQTRNAVYIHCSDLDEKSRNTMIIDIIAALEFCEKTGKDELIVRNITPWIRVGRDKVSDVPEAQENVDALFKDACKAKRRKVPVSRLDLRHGEFDVRYYVGKSRPADHRHEDDWLDGSR